MKYLTNAATSVMNPKERLTSNATFSADFSYFNFIICSFLQNYGTAYQVRNRDVLFHKSISLIYFAHQHLFNLKTSFIMNAFFSHPEAIPVDRADLSEAVETVNHQNRCVSGFQLMSPFHRSNACRKERGYVQTSQTALRTGVGRHAVERGDFKSRIENENRSEASR